MSRSSYYERKQAPPEPDTGWDAPLIAPEMEVLLDRTEGTERSAPVDGFSRRGRLRHLVFHAGSQKSQGRLFEALKNIRLMERFADNRYFELYEEDREELVTRLMQEIGRLDAKLKVGRRRAPVREIAQPGRRTTNPVRHRS